jgi:hypothetical protein
MHGEAARFEKFFLVTHAMMIKGAGVDTFSSSKKRSDHDDKLQVLKNGLPLVLQIVGPRWGEGTVLNAAHAFQQATQWHIKHPMLA